MFAHSTTERMAEAFVSRRVAARRRTGLGKRHVREVESGWLGDSRYGFLQSARCGGTAREECLVCVGGVIAARLERYVAGIRAGWRWEEDCRIDALGANRVEMEWVMKQLRKTRGTEPRHATLTCASVGRGRRVSEV